MRSYLRRLICGVVVSAMAMAIPAAPQGQSTRPAPGSPGGRPGGRPAGNTRPIGNNRPSPGGGGSRPQPSRPGQGGSRPGPGNGRPNPGRPYPGRPNGGRPGGGRPASWGRPPQQRPNYGFRPNDRNLLLRHYGSRLRYINRARRPLFAIGGYFPYGDIGYISPLPVGLYGQLPPAPMGYQMGYFDGYVVVYDPVTYFVANMVDLLAQ